MLSEMNINYEMEGVGDKIIRNLASITSAGPDDMSFCYYDGNKAIDIISHSNAGIILCSKILQGAVKPKNDSQIFFLDRPRHVFVKLANKMFEKQKIIGISPRSVISKTAQIGNGCYIGDYTLIGDNCKIGNETIIHDRVTLEKDCIIGERCVIHSGVALCNDGFSFERDGAGLYKFPQLGKLRIGNDVEICSNSHIANGALSDTVIGDGTKIDSMVHISHNVVVGKNCEITAGAVIGGSAKIGDSTWIGLNATIKDHATVGKNVIVASGASVVSDVADNDIVAGVPAKSIKHKVRASKDSIFLMAGQ
ncbi:MAG: UDP-3-O-(3-hydroxymyristoyl)glucosamine N-acyltransferase [Thaumarchaeota archaeon]|nr:UDP-3-O-(3-hydroxymyristoyl)glucosamine N-acyltransferase [Nitrososphaerota archaeon]